MKGDLTAKVRDFTRTLKVIKHLPHLLSLSLSLSPDVHCYY